MNQSLDLIQDLDFSTAIDSTETIVGGLSIACRPIHFEGGDGVINWGGCFPQPRPYPRPRPLPFPIHDNNPFPLPKPQPWPLPKHPPIELYATTSAMS